MSKGIGQKIAIEFTEKLVGDVSGKNPPSVRGKKYFRPIGTATASGQYSSYAPSRAFDGDTSSYWYIQTTGTQWIQVQFSERTYASGFRWNVGSYAPNGFNVYGSEDGVNWNLLTTDNSPNDSGWYAFEFPISAWLYYRWEITSRHSSYLRIQDIELQEAAGNEAAFTVTGQEFKYINGPIVEKTYQVDSVEWHPGFADDKHLLLTFHPQGRFNNVEDSLTVSYDHTLGNLKGRGGFVESFTLTFEPTDLVSFPQPNAEQIITTEAFTTMAFIWIEYNHRFEEELITVSPACSIAFLNVEDVNP